MVRRGMRAGPPRRGFLGLPELRPSVTPLLVATDFWAVLLAGLATFGEMQVEVLAGVATALALGRARELYRSRLTFSILEEIPTYLLASIFAALATVATRALTGESTRPLVAAVLAGFVLVGITVLRLAVYMTLTQLRRRRRISHPVIVVGADAVGKRVAEALLRKPEHGLSPVGIIESADDVRARDLPVPLLGTVEDLPLALTDLGVQDVVFAHPEPSRVQTGAALRDCLARDCQVFVVPRFFEVMGRNARGQIELVTDVPLLRLKRHPLQPHRVLMKRLFDIVVALVVLVLAAPLMLLCAIAVRLETGPGVLFRQTRVGVGGRTFTLYKFRSMQPATPEDGDTTWSIARDPRVGPVGRFIRRHSLDELPQLYNVLRGDMSIVGPRPERPHFVEEFSSDHERYHDRHRVPVGLTGWAQINDLRGNTPIGDRVRFDNYYIENWTLWGDIKIVVRTAHAVLRPPPAGRQPLFDPVLIPRPLDAEDKRQADVRS